MTDDLLEDTPLGTIIRSDWDNEYLKEVYEIEKGLRRAICGARKKDGSPCKGKPKKEYHYYCRLHRETGELQLTPAEVQNPIVSQANLPATQRVTPPVLKVDEIRHGLLKCNICPVRKDCEEYLQGHYCRIEERIMNNFIETVNRDYELEYVDQHMLISAGFRFINGWRAQIAASRMNPIEAEASHLNWWAPREMKEFVRLMKELGLTRKERLEQQRDELMPAGAKSSGSLAEMMTQLALEEGDEVSVTRAVQTKVTKKNKPDVIDAELLYSDDDLE